MTEQQLDHHEQEDKDGEVVDPRDEVDLGYATSPSDPRYTTETTNGVKPIKKSNCFGTSSNLVNSIVGAGIIGIPYAFRQSGIVAGLVLLVIVAYLTDKSLRIIVEAANWHPKIKDRHVTSFEKLAWFIFGKAGKIFILVCMFIMAYGAMVAYLLIIKDTVPTLLGVGHGMEGGIIREIILIITSLTIMVPLSMQRDMATLSFTSCLSVAADTLLVLFIMAYSPVEQTIQSSGGISQILAQDSIKPTVFIGLGIISTAMACQHSAFIVSGSLRNLTASRWAVVTCSSLSLATCLCALLGTTGYLGFLDETQGDVLNNFGQTGKVENVARGLLAITMFFTYPMESFVGRHVLSSLFYNGDMEGTDDVPTSTTTCEPPGGFWNRRRCLTIGLYIMCLIPALIFDDLGPVLSITGSLGGSCIAYVAPGAVYLGINGAEFIALANRLLGNKQEQRVNENGGEIELPAAGDANQVMANSNSNGHLELPIDGEHRIAVPMVHNGTKPCWWYILGFPIWYGIASHGSMTLEKNLADTSPTTETLISSEEEDVVVEEEQYSPPTILNYIIAISMILFGCIAAVAGVASNIYVQIRGL